MKLYQKAKTGKVKWLELYTEGDDFCTRWGLTDSDKVQETRKRCKPMNVGRANATTAAEQAVAEMEAKITKKKKQGYTESLDGADEVVTTEIDLDSLPESFCPCKPAKDPSKKLVDDPGTFGQVKRNGHCLVLVKGKAERIYSRGMEELTEFLCDIPEIKGALDHMKDGTMLIAEFCFVKNSNGKDSPRCSGHVARKKNHDEAMENYNGLLKEGHFDLVPLDLMFHDWKFIGNTDFLTNRYELMKKMMGGRNVLPIIRDWQAFFEEHRGEKESDIEGLVLRNAGEKSFIHFTLNGKADKAGSWKWKYVFEDDFIVLRAEKGKSGKHAGFYAQFFLAQYDSKGELVEYGKCGGGKLKHDELKQLTEDIDSGRLKFPFVIEVEYQSRQEDSGCCEFPQFIRVRDDKKPEECVFDL